MRSSLSFLLRGRADAPEFDLPWSDGDGDAGKQNPTVIADWRLIHYLAQGGIRVSTRRKSVRRRQVRFLWLAGFLMALWVVFRFV